RLSRGPQSESGLSCPGCSECGTDAVSGTVSVAGTLTLCSVRIGCIEASLSIGATSMTHDPPEGSSANNQRCAARFAWANSAGNEGPAVNAAAAECTCSLSTGWGPPRCAVMSAIARLVSSSAAADCRSGSVAAPCASAAEPLLSTMLNYAQPAGVRPAGQPPLTLFRRRW